MAHDESPDLTASMRPLRLAYLRRLQGHSTELEAGARALRTGALPENLVHSLHRLAHNYKGSGTTFGFPAISRGAGELMQALEPAPGMPPAAAVQILPLVENLARHMAEAVAASESSQPAAASMAAAQTPSDERLLVLFAPADGVPEAALQLERFQYRVQNATGWPAYESLLAAGPHAVLIAGELSAADAARLAILHRHAGELGQRIPVIRLARADDFAARLSAVRLGAQAYLTGEADALKLVDTIERLAARQTGGQDYHVLVVDDDEMLAQFCQHSLQQAGMKATVLSDAETVLRTLVTRNVDLLLVDFSMPGCTGEELAAIVRQHENCLSLPIIFMSARADIEQALIGTGLGIDDFLVKPFTAAQLLSVVASRGQRAAELQSLMVRDHFTGLFNHAQFIDMLDREVEQVARGGRAAVYVTLDIDHFKSINDRFGHAAGDRVIKGLSRLLQLRLRRSDIIGRCGGEEFGIVMPGCGLEAAHRIVENMRLAFSENAGDFAPDGVSVTFSAGLAAIDGESGADAVLRSGDAALYAAKNQGRNRLVIAAA